MTSGAVAFQILIPHLVDLDIDLDLDEKEIIETLLDRNEKIVHRDLLAKIKVDNHFKIELQRLLEINPSTLQLTTLSSPSFHQSEYHLAEGDCGEIANYDGPRPDLVLVEGSTDPTQYFRKTQGHPANNLQLADSRAANYWRSCSRSLPFEGVPVVFVRQTGHAGKPDLKTAEKDREVRVFLLTTRPFSTDQSTAG